MRFPRNRDPADGPHSPPVPPVGSAHTTGAHARGAHAAEVSSPMSRRKRAAAIIGLLAALGGTLYGMEETIDTGNYHAPAVSPTYPTPAPTSPEITPLPSPTTPSPPPSSPPGPGRSPGGGGPGPGGPGGQALQTLHIERRFLTTDGSATFNQSSFTSLASLVQQRLGQGWTLSNESVTGHASDEWLALGGSSLGRHDALNEQLATARARAASHDLTLALRQAGVSVNVTPTLDGQEDVLSSQTIRTLETQTSQHSASALVTAIHNYSQSSRSLPAGARNLYNRNIANQRSAVIDLTFTRQAAHSAQPLPAPDQSGPATATTASYTSQLPEKVTPQPAEVALPTPDAAPDTAVEAPTAVQAPAAPEKPATLPRPAMALAALGLASLRGPGRRQAAGSGRSYETFAAAHYEDWIDYRQRFASRTAAIAAYLARQAEKLAKKRKKRHKANRLFALSGRGEV